MKPFEWSIKLLTEGPIEAEKILTALQPLGKAEVVGYRIKPTPREAKKS